MKRFTVLLILILSSIVLYAQPTPAKIQEDLYNDMVVTLNETFSYRVSEGNKIDLELTRVTFLGHKLTGYFRTVKRTKIGKGKNKVIIDKGTFFTFDGGDATVIKHRHYLNHWSDKRLDTEIDLKTKEIKFVLL